MDDLFEYGFTKRDRPLRERVPDRISALNDTEQHDGNRCHQEDVNEASERVGRDDAEQPQDEEDDESVESISFLIVSKE